MSYNGYKNYETWAVCLWIDNEESSYRYWKDQAIEIYTEELNDIGNINDDGSVNTDQARQNARIRLAEEIKYLIEEEMPEVGGVWADLLQAAASEIDWHEVASTRFDE